jgi:hypothetical protein
VTTGGSNLTSYLGEYVPNVETKVPSLSGKAHEIPLLQTRASEHGTNEVQVEATIVTAAVIYFSVWRCANLATCVHRTYEIDRRIVSRDCNLRRFYDVCRRC